jgi:hypothetical protein
MALLFIIPIKAYFEINNATQIGCAFNYFPRSIGFLPRKMTTIVPAYVYTWFPFSKLSYLPQHGDQIAAATIFFHLIYLLGHVFSKNNLYYKKLDRSKQASWCIHIVSQVFSSTVLIASIPTFSEQELLADKLFGTTHYTRSLVAYACGYFLWDTIISIYYIDVTGPPFVFHGFACFSVFFLSYVCQFN